MINLIVFSKDRPWQLSEYLRTFFWLCTDQYRARVSVIYSSTSPETDSLYQILIHRYLGVNFIRQSDSCSFSSAVSALINLSDNHIMFGVDDLLWYDEFELQPITYILDTRPDILGYSFRLHPGISYCQPANCEEKCPEYKKVFVGKDMIGLEYRCSPPDVDFCYPYEVSSSMYRAKDIRAILSKSLSWRAINTPNDLESIPYEMRIVPVGNNLMSSKPLCSVITVNRVQDKYPNATYDCGKTLVELNENLRNHVKFDTEWYRLNAPKDRIHIGDMVTK